MLTKKCQQKIREKIDLLLISQLTLKNLLTKLAFLANIETLAAILAEISSLFFSNIPIILLQKINSNKNFKKLANFTVRKPKFQILDTHAHIKSIRIICLTIICRFFDKWSFLGQEQVPKSSPNLKNILYLNVFGWASQ